MNKISYSGYRFPPEIIQQAIWLYLRFTLSLRDVEDFEPFEGVFMGVLEVGEPAAQQAVQIGHDACEGVASRTFRLGSDAVFQLGQALLAHVTLAGFEAVAEELEPLPRLPAVPDMRLLGVQREAVLAHPCAHVLEGGFRLLARPTQDSLSAGSRSRTKPFGVG